MSPTSPTFVTLNDQLNKAHHRIRELEARETELLAQIGSLCAVITERTRDGRYDRQAQRVKVLECKMFHNVRA